MDRCEELFQLIKRDGITAIQRLFEGREAESYFLDFKRSCDDGEGKRLAVNDRVNLSTAISAFGNSEGGLVIWGINCRPGTDGADVIQGECLVTNPRRFASLLSGAVSGATLPPHKSVENLPIETGGSKGFVVTFIPKSFDAPHQVERDKRYYVRTGSDSIPAPHGLISGMFGRRPQPYIVPEFRFTQATVDVDRTRHLISSIAKVAPREEASKKLIFVEMTLLLRNRGMGIANDPFVVLDADSYPSMGSEMVVSIPMRECWQPTISTGKYLGDRVVHANAIGSSGFRIPPAGVVPVLLINLRLAPPFTRGLRLSGKVGADHSPAESFSFSNTADSLNKLYDKRSGAPDHPDTFQGTQEEYAQLILGIK